MKQWRILPAYVQNAMKVQSNRRRMLEKQLDKFEAQQEVTHTCQTSGGPGAVNHYLPDEPILFFVGSQHYRVWINARKQLKVNCSSSYKVIPEASNAVAFEVDR